MRFDPAVIKKLGNKFRVLNSHVYSAEEKLSYHPSHSELLLLNIKDNNTNHTKEEKEEKKAFHVKNDKVVCGVILS
jgi:hypothetical protein